MVKILLVLIAMQYYSFAVAQEEDSDLSFLDEGDNEFNEALNRIEESFKKSSKRESKALKYAKAQKTAGLLRSAAQKSKADKASTDMNNITHKVLDKLNEADRLIESMKKELQKAGVS